MGEPHFVCFIAWDARNASTEVVSTVVERLLDAGAVYISAWGADCERVHDIADEIRSLQHASADQSDSVIMTTSHEQERLEDALWFFLSYTVPDRAFEGSTHSGLAIAIGDRNWSETIHEALQDPTGFARKMTE